MSCFILLYTFVGAALHKIPETLWSSALNLSYDVITEKQTAQYNVLILSVYVVRFYKERWVLTVFSQLWGLFSPHSNIQLCGRMFSFSSKGDVQRRKRKGKNRAKKEWKSMSKEVRVTLSHPAVSSLVGLPLSGFLGVFFVPLLVHVWFWVWNLSPGMLYQRRWKQERAETRGWERHGGGNVETDRG